MNKGIVALGLATLGFGSASAYLLGELRDEREQTKSLQAQLDGMQRERPQQQNPFDSPPPPPAMLALMSSIIFWSSPRSAAESAGVGAPVPPRAVTMLSSNGLTNTGFRPTSIGVVAPVMGCFASTLTT